MPRTNRSGCACQAVQNVATRIGSSLSTSETHVRRHEQRESSVVMLVVAPWEESAAVDASMLDVGKGQRKVRAIFERLEVRPAKWVIIKDMRLREALRDAETAEELRDGLRCYRGSAISVNRQVRFDPKNEDNPRSPLALSFAGYEFLYAIVRSSRYRRADHVRRQTASPRVL